MWGINETIINCREEDKLYQAGNTHGLAANLGYVDIKNANIER